MTVTPTNVGPTLFHNARILAPNALDRAVDSVAVVAGTIVAVGPTSRCREVLTSEMNGSSNLTEVDLGGRTLTPGFADAHTHPLVMSVFENHLRFDDATSIGDVLDAVADRARQVEESSTVIGFQLDDALLAERRLPTGDELDAVAHGRKVVLIRRDGHHAVGSTAAILAAGLDDPAAVPAGGHVERDAAGRPTGLVGENAVSPLLGLMDEVSVESLAEGASSWSRRMLRQGITAMSAICQTAAEGPSGPAGELEAFGWSVLTDNLPFDIQTILIAPDLSHVDAWKGVASLHTPSARRRLDAIKLFLDGTLGGATACMHAPFADRSHTAGMRTLGDDDAYRRMVDAHLCGLQICIHAIGDKANRDAADLFARLLTEHPGTHRHRVEHASVLDARTIELFAEHGISCVVQPISIANERHWLADRLGAERLGRAYPYASLLRAGVNVAGSSDAPIEPTDVLAAMSAAVDRLGVAPAEALTPIEALAMYTTGSAHARMVADHQGQIAVGHAADFAVLSADPTEVGYGALVVDATVIGGAARFLSAPLRESLPPAVASHIDHSDLEHLKDAP
ncbi:MAG: amidohydrolase [Actinobacteria bacterium]|nr:amidohydrolase [Actinomycetota bacterium]